MACARCRDRRQGHRIAVGFEVAHQGRRVRELLAFEELWIREHRLVDLHPQRHERIARGRGAQLRLHPRRRIGESKAIQQRLRDLVPRPPNAIIKGVDHGLWINRARPELCRGSGRTTRP